MSAALAIAPDYLPPLAVNDNVRLMSSHCRGLLRLYSGPRTEYLSKTQTASKRVKSVVNGKTSYSIYDANGALIYIDQVTEGKETTYVDSSLGRWERRAGAWAFKYTHSDHLGTIQSATKQDGSIDFIEYSLPWGQANNRDAKNDNQARFTGHVDDTGTDLIYMQARHYDPRTKRFLSIDPVTFMDTGNPGYFNRYSYTMNDPVNNTDPDGRACVPCVPVAIFLLKEAGSEAVEQTTGVPMPTVKNAGKFAGKKALKTTRSLRGRKSFKDATTKNKANNNGKCEFCNKNEATQGDHIKPLNDFKKDVNAGKMTKADAKDIANKADNNAAACPSCNLSKGTKSLGDGPNDFKPPNPNDRIKDIMKDN